MMPLRSIDMLMAWRTRRSLSTSCSVLMRIPTASPVSSTMWDGSCLASSSVSRVASWTSPAWIMPARTTASFRNRILISPIVGLGVLQYSSFAFSRKWPALVYSTSLYGPLPTACVIAASPGWPLSHCGAGIPIFTTRLGKMASGAFVVMSTVRSSTFVAVAPRGPNSSMPWPGLAGSAVLVTIATTASALTGSPLWNLRPERSLKRQVFGSDCWV